LKFDLCNILVLNIALLQRFCVTMQSGPAKRSATLGYPSPKGDEGVKLKALYTAVAALSLVAAPTIVAAAPVATPLTQPAIESVDGDNALAGGGFLIAALAVVAVGLGIYAVADSDDSPNSP
jgi:hypothetical protein